jgi:acetyl esterase/lipase
MAAAPGPAIGAVELLFGPDESTGERWLREWAAAASAEQGVAVTATVAADEEELLRRLYERDPAAGLILATELPRALEAVAAAGGGATIWLGMRVAIGEPPAVLVEAGVQIVRGRGLDGLPWALKSMLARSRMPFTTHAYGPQRDQVADLRLPAGERPHPVVVLIHGGAWRANWERDLMDAVAVDLSDRGYATWNLEYRRVASGGGWPATCADTAAGIDALAALGARLDLGRVVLLGHSAGGHLAAWAAAREDARVKPALVFSLAGVLDLVEGANRGVYERAVEELMDGLPADRPAEYAAASPAELLPLGVPQLLLHGLLDLADNVEMNRGYAERARAAGDQVEMVELPGADHFDVIEPGTEAWARIVALLSERVPSGRDQPPPA